MLNASFMKFIANLVLLMLIAISFAACGTKSLDRDNCIHCTGCFNSWDECKEDYQQDSTHPYTWEHYVDSTIAQNQFSTDHCERVH